MYDVLMEIMEPKIKLREDKLRKEIRKENIQETINALKDLNLESTKIKSVITKAYKLSENEAEEYL